MTDANFAAMPPVNGARPDTARVERRLGFGPLIVDVSSRLVHARPDELDREIEDALRRVCEALDIDLSVLWQWSQVAPDVILPTHVHCSPKLPRPSEPMRQDHYPWSKQQAQAGRMFAFSSPDELPPEAMIDRETCRLFNIKAAVCIPLSLKNEPPFGALGFNALRAARSWPDEVLKYLEVAAQSIANALVSRRRERQLQDSEARLAAGAELAGLAFYRVDFSERTVYADDRFCDLCGIAPEQQSGLQALEFWIAHLHLEDRERVLDLRRQLHEGQYDDLSLEYRFMHPVDGEKWIHHLARVVRRDATGHVVYTHGVLRDVTEAKRTENELRDLTRRLIRAHEDERALLARELHDDVTQRLAVLAIEAGQIELNASGKPRTAAIHAVREGLMRLSEDVHALSYQLHPSVLEELGLVEALRAECERRHQPTGTKLSVKLDPVPASLGREEALCLFRVAQEALNNVARHAGAGAASITLRQVDGGLMLGISDDGTGFDPARKGKGRSLGMANMRERVRLANGTLDIDTAPGKGTTILAWVPAKAGEQ